MSNEDCETTPGSASPPAGEDGVARTLGPYHLLERIGQGGMGSVWIAEQREPFRRRVAVKLVQHGLDTKEVLSRFELEHNVLALMDHANIARVYDAGATPAGRPYFVMEYVPGLPITEYCDRHQLSLEERLRLLIDVCRAVQHAHQKGVIHRDIKPSNVLVVLDDDRPVPKIIDFGVAKATGSGLNAQTIYTQLGQALGTPAYMSPEQVRMDAEEVDTRSDVYSLGVLLYELLSGDLPLGSDSLRRIGYLEIQRRICDTDPPRPSERVATLKPETLENTAQQRSSHVNGLVRMLRGDLDWITMKALSRERTRRYASASEMAADLERHLEGEAVLAGPPSLGYRLRKFAGRNRALVGSAVAVLAAIVVGLIVSIALYFEADSAHDAEARARQLAVKHERAARRSLEKAEAYAEELEAQKAETQTQFEEAQRILALYYWQAGDRAYEDGRFDVACAKYAEALGLGVAEIGRQEQIDRGLKGMEVLEGRMWPQIGAALARLPRGPALLYPDIGWACQSPSGRLTAACASVGPVIVWEPPALRPLYVVETQEEPTAMHFLDEDTLVYVAGNWMDGSRVGVVDLARETVERRYTTGASCSDVAISPDRLLIALAQTDGCTLLLDTRTWEEQESLTPEIVAEERRDPASFRNRAVEAVALDAEGAHVATWSRDRLLRLWDLHGRKELATFEAEVNVVDLTFVGDRLVLVWSREGLGVVDFRQEPPAARSVYKGNVIAAAAQSPSRVLALTDAGLGVTKNGDPLRLDPLPEPYAGLVRTAVARHRVSQIHPAVGRWVPFQADEFLLLFDTETDRISHEAGRVTTYPGINCFSADGSTLLVAGTRFDPGPGASHYPPEIYRMTGEGGTVLLDAHDPEVKVVAMDIAGNGRTAITGDARGVLRSYAAPDWRLLDSEHVASGIRDVALSFDGGKLYVLQRGGALEVREPRSLADVVTSRDVGTSDTGGTLRAHPGGGVWLGDAMGHVVLLEPKALQPVHDFEVETGPVIRLHVAPDGTWLAAMDGAGHLGFWPQLDDGQYWSHTETRYLGGNFSSNGGLFALALRGGEIHILDTATRRIAARLGTSDRNVVAACFDGANEHVLFSGFDNGPGRFTIPPRLDTERYVDHDTYIRDVASSPVAPLYASLDGAGLLVLRRLRGRPHVRRLQLTGALKRSHIAESIHFTDDGTVLVVKAPDGRLVLVSAEGGEVLAETDSGGNESPYDPFCVVGTGSTGRILALRDRRLESISLADPSEVEVVVEDLPDGACRLVCTPDGDACFIGFIDGHVRMVDVPGQRIAWTRRHPESEKAREILSDEAASAVVHLEVTDRGSLITAGLSVGHSVVALDVDTGETKGTLAHLCFQAADSVRSRRHGVVVSTSLQQSFLTVASQEVQGTHIVWLPDPADHAGAVDVLHDDSAIIASDGHQVLVIPVDMRALALEADDLADYLRERLEISALTRSEAASFYALREEGER